MLGAGAPARVMAVSPQAGARRVFKPSHPVFRLATADEDFSGPEQGGLERCKMTRRVSNQGVITMKPYLTGALATIALLAACSGTPRLHDSDVVDHYLDYAGAPISSFNSLGGFNGWRPLGRDKLMVWKGVSEAYLLTVDSFCTNLEFAERIGVTSTGSSVMSGFDYVRVRNGIFRQKCRILEIRPLDYQRMRADMRAQGK
jgi:hypothetical protein